MAVGTTSAYTQGWVMILYRVVYERYVPITGLGFAFIRGAVSGSVTFFPTSKTSGI